MSSCSSKKGKRIRSSAELKAANPPGGQPADAEQNSRLLSEADENIRNRLGSGLLAPGETLRYPVTDSEGTGGLFPWRSQTTCFHVLAFCYIMKRDRRMSGYTAQTYAGDWFISLINMTMLLSGAPDRSRACSLFSGCLCYVCGSSSESALISYIYFLTE